MRVVRSKGSIPPERELSMLQDLYERIRNLSTFRDEVLMRYTGRHSDNVARADMNTSTAFNPFPLLLSWPARMHTNTATSICKGRFATLHDHYVIFGFVQLDHTVFFAVRN